MIFLKGLLIGSAAILPGISGGVLCMSLGLYEQIIESVLHFLKNPKKHFSFLFPLFLSIGIGILLSSRILESFYTNYEKATCIVFSILILATIPSLLKEGNIKFSVCHFLSFLLTFSFSILLTAIKKQELSLFIITTPSFIQLLIIGFIVSCGIVIPGISKSVILMIFGLYSLYLSSIATLNLQILIPIAIGILIGSFVFLKIINFCFKHFKSYTYSSILGFVVGSLLILLI